MTSEIKHVSGENLSHSAKRELAEGAGAVEHTNYAGVGNMLTSLVRNHPEIDTQLATASFIATAQTVTDRQPSPAAAEVDQGFASGFPSETIWNGALAEGADNAPMQAGAAIMNQEAETTAPASQPAGYVDLGQEGVSPLTAEEQYLDHMLASPDAPLAANNLDSRDPQTIYDQVNHLEDSRAGVEAALAGGGAQR